jgi:hypothetical protein
MKSNTFILFYLGHKTTEKDLSYYFFLKIRYQERSGRVPIKPYVESYQFYLVYKYHCLYYIQYIIYLLTMKSTTFGIIVLLLISLSIICYADKTTKSTNSNTRRCKKPSNGRHMCYCGKNQLFDRLKGEKCINGRVEKTK